MSIMLIMSCYTGFFNVRRGWQSLNTVPRFYLRLIRRTGWLWIYASRTTDGRPFKPKKPPVPFLYPGVPAGFVCFGWSIWTYILVCMRVWFGYMDLDLVCICDVVYGPRWNVCVVIWEYGSKFSVYYGVCWPISIVCMCCFGMGGRYQILCLHHMVPYVVGIRSYVYTTRFPRW